MKIATIVIRTLIGLLLLFASISYFFKLMPQPEILFVGNLFLIYGNWTIIKLCLWQNSFTKEKFLNLYLLPNFS
jgi:hypothetical protein